MPVRSSGSKRSERVLKIPLEKEALSNLRKGQCVKAGESISCRKISNLFEIDLSKLEGLDKDALLENLLKKLGKNVEKGEALFKFGKKKLVSPVSGRVDSITDDGVLKIAKEEGENLTFPFDFEIIELDTDGLKIKLDADEFECREVFGKPVFGALKIFEGKEFLGFVEGLDNHIVLVRESLPLSFFYKLQALDISGLVLGFLSDILRRQLESENFPVMVFGEKAGIDKASWEKITDKKNPFAFLNFEDKKLIIK